MGRRTLNTEEWGGGSRVWLSVLGPKLHYVWTARSVYCLWLEEGWAPEGGKNNAGPLGFATELEILEWFGPLEFPSFP